MFGGSLVWFYRRVAGMNADPSRPGYRHIVFRPVPPDSLTFARYDKETPYGEASIEWRRTDGRFEMTVQVPVGCTATVWVPGAGLPIRYRPMSARGRQRQESFVRGYP